VSWQNNIKMNFEERLQGNGLEKVIVYREPG
jgi:hypothetical protein